MSALVPFFFEDRTVRTEMRDGEPWFCAADVCFILGIQYHRDAIAKLDPDERGSLKVDTLGGPQELGAISEAGLYTLILRSRDAVTPGTVAHRFRKWVTAEVLPAIRRTGRYGAPDPMMALNDPATMRTLLLSYSEKVLALEAVNAELAPKADALDRLTRADGALAITDAAKALSVRPNEMFRWLAAHGWTYRRPGGKHLLGYQSKVQAGYLEHRVSTIQASDGGEKIVERVLVTPKGLARLATLFPAQTPLGLN